VCFVRCRPLKKTSEFVLLASQRPLRGMSKLAMLSVGELRVSWIGWMDKQKLLFEIRIFFGAVNRLIEGLITAKAKILAFLTT